MVSMKVIWALPLLAWTLAADDLNGKWTGIIEVADASSGTVINTPIRAEFAQKASALSGKIGRREDEQAEAIRNGRVEGKKVSFEVLSPETAGAVKFALTLDGDQLEGEMQGSMDAGPITGKVHLKRETGQSNIR